MARRWSLTLMMLMFGTGYTLTFTHLVKVLKYFPVQHIWAFEGPDPSMGWYGKLLVAFILGSIGLFVGLILDMRDVSTESTSAKTFDLLGWISVMLAMTVAIVHEVRDWL